MMSVAPTKALEVVKGGAPPLTAQQQELVTIFIEHLRNLPEITERWNDACTRRYGNETNYNLIYELLVAYFDRRHPVMSQTGSKLWDNLNQAEADKFNDLMHNAGSPKGDSRIERKRELLRLGRAKKTALAFIGYYERDRREAGLPPDDSLRLLRGPVGLEVATQNTWGNGGVA